MSVTDDIERLQQALEQTRKHWRMCEERAARANNDMEHAEWMLRQTQKKTHKEITKCP
jgi:hypothetical protein